MQSLCRSRGIPVLRAAESELGTLVGEVTVRLDRESVVLGEIMPLPQSSRLQVTTFDETESI